VELVLAAPPLEDAAAARLRGAAVHRYTIRVRYADTDQMGFAYYGNYLRWFEIGRAEMLRASGTSYRSIEADERVRLPVLEAGCRYREPARYDDELVIETGVAELRRASVRFRYRVLREADGVLIAEGFTEHCFMSHENRPVRPPRMLVGLLETAPRAI
jgi:acyl-CoA thioester hydrolase